MDSSGSNASLQPVSDVSIRNDEETLVSPLNIDPSQSSEETVPMELDDPQPLDQDDLMAMQDDQDREYGCKYCDKKFSNKQALGGHQNAHKVERTLEKTARDAQENGLGFFGGSSTSHFLSSYHRSHDFMTRSYLSWPYPSQHHGLTIGYSSRPGIPMPVEPYGPPRPVPGFGHVYGAGWAPPLPRLPQFPGYHSPYIPNHDLNLRFPNAGEDSSRFVRPVSNHQDLAAFAGTLRIGPGGDPGEGSSANRMNGLGDQEEVDESGLDLTLKL